MANQRKANIAAVQKSQKSLEATKKLKAEAIALESERNSEEMSLRDLEEVEMSRARTAYSKDTQERKIKTRQQKTKFVNSFVNQSNSLIRVMHQNGRKLSESVRLYQARQQNHFMREEAEYKKSKVAEAKEQKRLRTREKHLERKEFLRKAMMSREEERKSGGRKGEERESERPPSGDASVSGESGSRNSLKMGQVTSVSQIRPSRSSRRKKS